MSIPDKMLTGKSITLHEGALEMLSMAMLIHNHEFVLYANRAALKMLGATDYSQIEGKPLSQIVHPDGAEAGAARRAIIMEHGYSVTDVPVKLVGADGIVRYAIVSGMPILHGDNEQAILVTATLTRIGTDEAEITPPR